MASQGPNSAGLGVNDTSIGSQSWQNPTNIYSSNNVYAGQTGPNSVIYNYLKATNFGFTIPSGATIDGIKVEVECSGAPAANTFPKEYSIKIVKGGIIGGTNKANTANTLPQYVDAYVTYGGSTDEWGLSWTYSDINASNFGIAFSVSVDWDKAPVSVLVDHIRITVYYTEGGGGGSAIKSVNGLAKASCKSINNLAIASVKSFNGLE